MKRSRFSAEQVIGILKEQEAGAATADVCRRHGISSATFYKWKAKYSGLEVSDTRRPKALEDENARLKKLLAEAMLDNAILKDVSAKKWWRPTRSEQRWRMCARHTRKASVGRAACFRLIARRCVMLAVARTMRNCVPGFAPWPRNGVGSGIGAST